MTILVSSVEACFRKRGGDLHRTEHQGEAVIDAAKPANQTKTVRISHQETQGIASLG